MSLRPCWLRAGSFTSQTLIRDLPCWKNTLEGLCPRTIFQTPPDRPLQFADETTYTGDPTIMSHQSTREWIHSLSAALGGLIDAGLAITMFREHEVLPWRGLTSLVPVSERMWRLPDGVPRIPLSYSLRAKKGS
jgi:hypothetical protein